MRFLLVSWECGHDGDRTRIAHAVSNHVSSARTRHSEPTPLTQTHSLPVAVRAQACAFSKPFLTFPLLIARRRCLQQLRLWLSVSMFNFRIVDFHSCAILPPYYPRRQLSIGFWIAHPECLKHDLRAHDRVRVSISPGRISSEEQPAADCRVL